MEKSKQRVTNGENSNAIVHATESKDLVKHRDIGLPTASTTATGSAPEVTIQATKSRPRIFTGSGTNQAQPEWNQPGKADPVARSNHTIPSVMRMGAQMVLHSHLAINLFRGRQGDVQRKLRPIIGLARFARQVALVWSAAENDDPYADQCLLDVEIKCTEAKQLLDDRESTLNDIICGLEGLSVDIQTSVKPAAIELNFFCPWSYQATLLLLQFDRIVRLSLTARHIGLLGDKEWDSVVSNSARALRHIFTLPNRWVHTGVTRDDCRKKTKVAKRAHTAYVETKEDRIELSESVLLGEARARIAPQNRILEKYLSSLTL